MWYRVKACLYFVIFLCASPFWLILTLISWLFGRTSRMLKGKQAADTIAVETSPLSPNLRRTVLMTDGVQTKSLHVLRILAKAGHRIILVESDQYKYSASSWSKYVSRTRYVPHHNLKTMDKYVDGVVKVALEEKVDWFVPTSKTYSAIPNYMVEQKLAKVCPRIKCFGFGSLELALLLNDKRLFLGECQRLGLSTPDFRIISQVEDLYKLRDENFFKKRHYFLKPAKDYSEDRDNFKRVPHDVIAFKEYVKTYELKITVDQPYFVCEFINGSEYVSNAICRNGKILAFQVCASSSNQMDYDSIDHQEIEDWTREFCSKMKISGGICFDFIQDHHTKTIYCIECNPRLHSAITSFHYDPKLAVTIQAVLEPENVQDEKVVFPVKPPDQSPHVYWLYQEVFKLFTGRQGIGEFVSTVLHGKEAVYDNDDPLPFLILNTIHMMFQLKKKIVANVHWSFVNPCLGRLGK